MHIYIDSLKIGAAIASKQYAPVLKIFSALFGFGSTFIPDANSMNKMIDKKIAENNEILLKCIDNKFAQFLYDLTSSDHISLITADLDTANNAALTQNYKEELDSLTHAANECKYLAYFMADWGNKNDRSVNEVIHLLPYALFFTSECSVIFGTVIAKINAYSYMGLPHISTQVIKDEWKDSLDIIKTFIINAKQRFIATYKPTCFKLSKQFSFIAFSNVFLCTQYKNVYVLAFFFFLSDNQFCQLV